VPKGLNDVIHLIAVADVLALYACVAFRLHASLIGLPQLAR